MSNSLKRPFSRLSSGYRIASAALRLALTALSLAACSSDSGTATMPMVGAGTGAGVTGTPAGGAPSTAAGTGAAGSTTTGSAGSTTVAAGTSGGTATTGGRGGVGPSGMAGTGAGTTAGAGGAATAGTGSMTAGTGAAGSGGAAGMMAVGGSGGGMATDGACTREMLATAVQNYYKAISAHDPKLMNPAPSIKLTEQGKAIMAGEGLMKTAGMVKFTRSALDTLQCETATESVVENTGDDFVVGTRLKVAAGQITEVESILVGPDGWFPNPMAILNSKNEDWEKPLLQESERWTRDKLKKDIVDGYFVGVFGGKIPVAQFPFASDCKRSENGFSPGACNFGIPTSMPMTPLHYVVDVEAGIAAGFVLFGGRASGLDDFHMFRVKSGQVHSVHAVVGPTVMGRGWPTDPAGTP